MHNSMDLGPTVMQWKRTYGVAMSHVRCYHWSNQSHCYYESSTI